MTQTTAHIEDGMTEEQKVQGAQATDAAAPTEEVEAEAEEDEEVEAKVFGQDQFSFSCTK